MNNIEERLWNYIDGNCIADEQKAIAQLIATDELYRSRYQELISFNEQLIKMDTDEPSMAFTYNVMESIRAEYAQQPLKAAINKNIIRVVAAFFVFSIVLLLVYVLSSVQFSAGNVSFKIPVEIKVSDVKNVFNESVLKAFLLLDLVLGLFLADAFIRRRKLAKHADF